MQNEICETMKTVNLKVTLKTVNVKEIKQRSSELPSLISDRRVY